MLLNRNVPIEHINHGSNVSEQDVPKEHMSFIRDVSIDCISHSKNVLIKCKNHSKDAPGRECSYRTYES